MTADINGETRLPRSVLRDLVALSAISAALVDREPDAVAAGLAEVVIELLRLEFAFVRLRVPGTADAVDVMRGTAWRPFSAWLEGHPAERGWLSGIEIIPDVNGGHETCRGVAIPIGVNAEGGVVVAASGRAGFPAQADQLLLSLVANHAATAFQNATLLRDRARTEEELCRVRDALETKVAERTAELRRSEAYLSEAQRLTHTQLWFLESMDVIDRAIQGTSDLEQMTGDVLDAVLVIFRCDRARLLYPCDPRADSLQVPAERTGPGCVGAPGAGLRIPNRPEVAGFASSLLAADGPVRFDPGSGRAPPSALAERFCITSTIAMAVHPKMAKPYAFALHQCSGQRVWAPHEERLFHEIGRRLADALDTLLMLRNLRESQRKLESSRAELAASRARIVTAADETRRRIERDLHDGVQQRLVSLVLAERQAEEAVPAELCDLRAQLSGLADGLVGALEELREISRGIHPAVLAHGGLMPALKALARRSAVPVELAVRVEARLPEPVERAAYYIVSEALTNAAKHAQASTVHVAVEARDGVLGLSIRDDGRGGADPARGSGLIGLTDRVDALAGAIEVASPTGAGTTLRITLPIKEG
ncbi:MAG: sensor histidine kinase [Trebonia sp.]